MADLVERLPGDPHGEAAAAPSELPLPGTQERDAVLSDHTVAAHADFWNTWDPVMMRPFTFGCLKQLNECPTVDDAARRGSVAQTGNA